MFFVKAVTKNVFENKSTLFIGRIEKKCVGQKYHTDTVNEAEQDPGTVKQVFVFFTSRYLEGTSFPMPQVGNTLWEIE